MGHKPKIFHSKMGNMSDLIVDTYDRLSDFSKPDYQNQVYFGLLFVGSDHLKPHVPLEELRTKKGVKMFLTRNRPDMLVMDCDGEVGEVRWEKYRDHEFKIRDDDHKYLIVRLYKWYAGEPDSVEFKVY